MILKILISYLLRDLPLHLIKLITELLPNHLYVNKLRGALSRPFIGACGRGLQIGRGVIINTPQNLTIGNDCYLSHNAYIQAKGHVEIHDSVIVGPMCIIASSKHIIKDGIVTNKGKSEPIVIGKGVFVGGHSTVQANVNIGEGAVIGSNSLVNKDVDCYTFVGGVPAKMIKSLQ